MTQEGETGGKKCTKCGKFKPLDEFYARKNAKDGLTWACKECTLAQTHDWYLAHRDHVLAKMREYQDTHKEQITAYNDEYKTINKEKINEKSKQYYATHKEQMIANRDPVKYHNACAEHQRRMQSDPIFVAAHLIVTRQNGALRKWEKTGHITESCSNGKSAKYIDYKRLIEHLGHCPGQRGPGSSADRWQVDHIINLRSLRLDVSNIAWQIGTHWKNTRWVTARENYDKGYEITVEAYELLCELYKEITGKDFDSEAAAEILVSNSLDES